MLVATTYASAAPTSTHSIVVGYVCWLLGFLGMHRFYYGKPVTGTIWFFTGGLLLIGWIVDAFLIPSMDAAAERRQDSDPPVTEIVTRPLDHDRPIVGHGAGGGVLFFEVVDQVGGGHRVQSVVAFECGDRVGRWLLAQLAHQLADRHAEFDRTARAFAFPERHLAGFAGSGGD